jgi:hypothetical protein
VRIKDASSKVRVDDVGRRQKESKIEKGWLREESSPLGGIPGSTREQVREAGVEEMNGDKEADTIQGREGCSDFMK